MMLVFCNSEIRSYLRCGKVIKLAMAIRKLLFTLHFPFLLKNNTCVLE